VAWKLYRPRDAGPVPLVVWSPGAGGSATGASYLGEHLASWGFAALHLTHQGSDGRALLLHGGEIRAAVNDPQMGADRYRDVQFAVRQVAASAQGAWAGQVDASRLGMSGHSFGAITTLIACGQAVPGFGQSLAVPAFRGGFAMSPSPPRAGYDDGAATFAHMLCPLFHLTGTEDDTPVETFPPAARRIPFERIGDVDQCLLVIAGGTHMTFSGRSWGFGALRSDPRLAEHLPLVEAAAVAFWDARLRDDAAARAWLDGGGYAAFLGAAGAFAFKPARAG